MNDQLWQKIKSYKLDNPDDHYGFLARLARENKWTQTFTSTAVKEYKKFMYLAAISESMVSPSPIIDLVWHQHLIYTHSYDDFCAVLGKCVAHVPSTGGANEHAKFAAAKEYTHQLYVATFGDQPKEIWNYPDMHSSLSLDKAKMKLRAFLLWGIFVFFVAITPAYLLLRPLYKHIPNPGFILFYLTLIAISFIMISSYVKRKMENWLQQLPEECFLLHLKPSELIYLKERSIAGIIHHEVNELFRASVISTTARMHIEVLNPTPDPPLEEQFILKAIAENKGHQYPVLFKRLLTHPFFRNPSFSIPAFEKYIHNSHLFFQLFKTSFIVLSGLFLLGFIRLLSGVIHGHKSGFLVVLLFLLLVGICFFLWHYTNHLIKNKIIRHYEKKIIPTYAKEEILMWHVPFMGRAAFTSAFLPLFIYAEPNITYPNNGDSSSGGCGSSCGGGGGCGGGCGGCGGCGG